MPADLLVERLAGSTRSLLLVSASAGGIRGSADTAAWLGEVDRLFAEWPEVASISAATDRELAQYCPGADMVETEAAKLPLCAISGRVADLVPLAAVADAGGAGLGALEQWVSAATAKGLRHVWLRHPSLPGADGSEWRTAPALAADARFVGGAFPETTVEAADRISVGIDAAWLLAGESGAQVFAFEMIRELASRDQIACISLLSDSGALPEALSGTPKLRGVSWTQALAPGAPRFDLLHRPYQPADDMDVRRYHQVAPCVALTVLDLIAYDNPTYHESDWAWRAYQRLVDERICAVDYLYAISSDVASRIERQYPHELPGPVHPVLLGTDHLAGDSVEPAAPAGVDAMTEPFLLVLGNDFQHKNRDFAVKVFAELRTRGYEGRLVLAGFHLDLGSTYGHELEAAGDCAPHIIRLGAVPAAAKKWLLQHAQVVLYPTSSEGFGLIPFEAAALGTPTAFVRFGPFRETLADVDAAAEWNVKAFADHVQRLQANPEAQVEQVRKAARSLTWARHVDQLLAGYERLLDASAPWRSRTRQLPGMRETAGRALSTYAYRSRRKLRRLFGKSE